MCKKFLLIPGSVFLMIISCTTIKNQESVPQVAEDPLAAENPLVMEMPLIEEPVIGVLTEDFTVTGYHSSGWEREITREQLILPLPEVCLPAPRKAFAKEAFPVVTDQSGATMALPQLPAANPPVATKAPTAASTPQPKKQTSPVPKVTAKKTQVITTSGNGEKNRPAPSPVYTPNLTPAPESIIKELYARPGNEIEINLMNNGWIFPGFVQEQDTTGLSFITRETGGDQTRFLFKAKQIGEYPLEFILQNNYTGNMQREKYLVKVVPESQFYAVLNNPVPEQENFLEKADALFAQKKYAQALTEYLKNYDEASGYLNSRVAEIYELLGDYETAARYWERNREAVAPYNDEAVSGIIRSAARQDDLNTVLKYLDIFKENENSRTVQDFIHIAEYLEKKGKTELAITLLDEYRQKAMGISSLEQLYFILAALYEKDTISRDFKKARDYYQRVCLEYPDSKYSSASAERIKYLNRHFFYIW